MAAPYNPPVKNEDFQVQVSLEDIASPGRFRTNPTLAAGDVKISKDGGALANLATLPVVAPSGSKLVTVALTATEMDADLVTIIFSDQTEPPEWAELVLSIPTTSA